MPAPSVSAPAGASKYIAVAPIRLADTRPTATSYGGFTNISASTIRVGVLGRPGVPDEATIAVLNVTIAEASGWGYATVYAGGTPLPGTSSVNADAPGRVVANMVHVMIGSNGAVDIFRSVPMHLIVDLVGVYVPVATDTTEGRLVTLAGGAYRVLDTRSGSPVFAGQTKSVDVAPAGIPSSASAVVVTVTAVTASRGFWSALPSGEGFTGTSTLNLDGDGQTRAGQAIVNLDGTTLFDVYSERGGHLLVDVVGYFTGVTEATSSIDGLFVPGPPARRLDTRQFSSLAPWSGSTFEFSVGAGALQVAAAAMNLTATSPWDLGYVTAYPAGVARPNSSNLNISAIPQTIANHAIVRVSNRGAALFTYGGAHLIADVFGWYLGTPSVATLPVPTNPVFNPNDAVAVYVPKIGVYMPIAAGATTQTLNQVANLGYAAAWSTDHRVATPGNVMLFGHRTTHGGPFRYLNLLLPGDEFILVGQDGHWYHYTVVDQRVTAPVFSIIKAIAAPYGPMTSQLVACSKPNGTPTSVKHRIVITGRFTSVT